MRCLITIPAWRYSDIRSKDTEGIAGVWPQPGVAYISAMLREAGHEVAILDGVFYTHQQMLDRIVAYHPDFLGVYSVAMMWPKAAMLVQDMKKLLPETFVTVGGHGPTALKEKCFQEAPALDAVVYGEGEATAQELVSKLENGESLSGTLGTIISENGKIVTGEPRIPIYNLDTLPFPAWDLFEIDRYQPSYGQVAKLPVIQVISSRGCPYKCIFCFRIAGQEVRLRSAENVVDEIQVAIEKFGAKEIKFWDELFTMERQRVIEICEEILRRNIKIVFWCSARADFVDPEVLALMKKAGCWTINFGVESAVDKNLKALCKEADVATMEKAIKMTHKAGIKTLGTYMFGIPGETYEEGLQTIEFAKRMNSFYVEFFNITPFPGTELYNNGPKYGHVTKELSEIGMLMDTTPFVPYSMTKEETLKLKKIAYTKYYGRPSFILKRLIAIRSWYDVKILLNGGISIIMIFLYRFGILKKKSELC